MSSRRKPTFVQLLILALISGSISNFIPLEFPIMQSTQCGEAERDMSDVIKSVQEMLSDHAPSTYPLSCMEVRENSPSSPSGYYTLSDGTGNTNIVYCNMDDLYSCPSLEQALRGIQLSLDHTTDIITSQLDGILESQDVTNTLSTAINNRVNSVLDAQDYSNTLSTAINNTVNSVLDGQNYTKTLITATYNNVSDVLDGQDYSNILNKAINNTVNDVLILTQKLINLHPPDRCEDLCNTTGPWTRVAFLNMSDHTQKCLNPFELYESHGVRACGRPHPLSKGFTCQSIIFPVNQTSYSQVCGRVIGYQYWSIDGFDGGSIDDVYVDGVSLTHGSPRQHIWSFAATKDISGTSSCPCAGGKSPPAFVESDYFCESGSNGGSLSQTMYTSDPLWDGQGCVGSEAACCQTTGIPWFHKVLSTPTTDFIELRICGYEDEDSPLSLYEIYVK